jgi:hypothetical protein
MGQQNEKQPPDYFDNMLNPLRLGYTLKITIHKAVDLPVADYASLSSDSYVLAEIDTL